MNKIDVHRAALENVNDKIHLLHQELAAIEGSMSADTKSSMGDKYETGREMMTQEKGKIASQLAIFQKHKATLQQLDATQVYDEVKMGSMVQTSAGWFYLSVALGKIEAGSGQVFLLSPAAPLAKAMITLRAGQTFTINGNEQQIKQVI